MATDTTEQFDPYRKWLGIPPKDQPPHHYRLLGIASFENDPDVIQNAADRQMAHVRNFQTGRYSELSQRILNELAAAKLCLLTESKKAEYDKELRAQLRAKKAAAAQAKVPVAAATPAANVPAALPATAVPVATEPPPEEPGVSPSPKISASRPVVHRRRRKKNNALPVAIAVVCLAVLVVGGLVTVSQLGDKKSKSSSKGSAGGSPTEPSPPNSKPKPKQSARPLPRSGLELPKTTDRPRTELENPLESAFNKPMPGSTTEPAVDRADQLREAIAQLRTALASRDISAAKSHLKKADELKQTPDESADVERLRQLLKFVEGFWEGVAGGVRAFQKSGSFEYQGRSYEFVSKEGEVLTYKVDGRDVSTPVRELAPPDAVAIALRDLDEDNAFDKFYVIAFLAVDDRGDIGAQREQAREMMRESIENGNQNEMLAAELNLSAGIPLPMPGSPDSPLQQPLGGLGTSPENALAPIPSAEDLREAKAALQPRLRRARTIQERAQLANDLNEEATNESDLVKKYELWTQARELAVEVRQVKLSMTITDSIAQAFEIDPLSQKQEALAKLAAEPQVDIDAVSQHADQLFQDAISQERFEVAGELAETRKRIATRKKQFDVVREIEEELKELEQQQKAAESERDSDDPAGT